MFFVCLFVQATSAIGEKSKLQADLESTQAALKAKGNVKVCPVPDISLRFGQIVESYSFIFYPFNSQDLIGNSPLQLLHIKTSYNNVVLDEGNNLYLMSLSNLITFLLDNVLILQRSYMLIQVKGGTFNYKQQLKASLIF